jgi:hypothetical protein
VKTPRRLFVIFSTLARTRPARLRHENRGKRKKHVRRCFRSAGHAWKFEYKE